MSETCQIFLAIEGSVDDLQHINELGFDFQTIHSCKFIPGTEEYNTWCKRYWGCKSLATDIHIDYIPGETRMNVHFTTQETLPDAILTFLTIQYPSLMIANEWRYGRYELAGFNVYSNGSMNCKYIEPWAYSDEVLEAFGDNNLWFPYFDYYDSFEGDVDEREEEDLLPLVEVITYTKTYEELIAE